MKEFVTDQEALDYLSARIAAEATRENVPLTEVERKMLYFSETDWTLPDMAAVNAEFDQDYDENEYGRKISGLVRMIEANHHGYDREAERTWDAAVEKLSEGDRYLLVLLDPSLSEPKSGRPPHDILKLWVTAFAIVFGIFGIAAAGNWLLGLKFRAVVDWVFQSRDHICFTVIFAGLVWYLGIKLKNLLRDALIGK